MQKLAGLILIVGVAIAFYGESRPVVGTVYSTSDMQTQLDAIAANSSSWATANTLMAAGGVVVAIGLILFAVQVQGLGVEKRVKTAAFAGAALAMIGALINAVERFNSINAWATYEGFPLPYQILWVIGLALIGIVLIWSSYPKWLGWLLVIASVLLFIGGAIGFLPPALIYFPLLVMAVVLLVKATPEPTRTNASSSLA